MRLLRLLWAAVAVMVLVLFGESFCSLYRRSAVTIDYFQVPSFSAPRSPRSAPAPRPHWSRLAGMRQLAAKGSGLLDALHNGATLLRTACKHGLIGAVQVLFRKVLQVDAAQAQG